MNDGLWNRSFAMLVAVVMLSLAAVAGCGEAPTSTVPAPSAAPAQAMEIPWHPRYDFALEVDGVPSPEAAFYQERDSRRLLVNAPELAPICLVNQNGQQVTALERSKVEIKEEPEEEAQLMPGAESGAPTTPYTIEGASVIFYVGPNKLKILPKHPLVGAVTKDEILRHSPLYKKGMRAYTPGPADVSYLRSYKTPVEIEVFFGTWCAHCKVLVPTFIRSMEEAGNPNLKISYHGVPNGFGTYPPAKSLGIKGIPTFIFRRDGKEIGRLRGEPTGSIEHAVVELLRSAQG